jgi:hypothetical protein
VESSVTVVVLDIWIELVLSQKNSSELLMAPVSGLVKRTPATAALQRMHVRVRGKASNLSPSFLDEQMLLRWHTISKNTKKTPAPVNHAWPTP